MPAPPVWLARALRARSQVATQQLHRLPLSRNHARPASGLSLCLLQSCDPLGEYRRLAPRLLTCRLSLLRAHKLLFGRRSFAISSQSRLLEFLAGRSLGQLAPRPLELSSEDGQLATQPLDGLLFGCQRTGRLGHHRFGCAFQHADPFGERRRLAPRLLTCRLSLLDPRTLLLGA